MAALGDSYSSGEGAGDYHPGTAGNCDRSPNAWALQLSKDVTKFAVNMPEGNLVACSGAVSNDLTKSVDGRKPQDTMLSALESSPGADYREALTLRVADCGAWNCALIPGRRVGLVAWRAPRQDRRQETLVGGQCTRPMAAGAQPRYALLPSCGEKVLVMTGPQDRAAAGGDRLRAGHADREQVIEALKAAFVHGRLTKAEFDTRVGQALSARTCADLAALAADIPAAPSGPLAASPARPPAPARRRPLARAAAGSGGCLFIAAAAMKIHAHLDPGATSTPHDSWAKYFVHRLRRRIDCTGDLGARSGHLRGEPALPRAAATPARAGRPRPGRRAPRPPHRQEPSGPARPQVTAAPTARFRPGGPSTRWRHGSARRGLTLGETDTGPGASLVAQAGLTPWSAPRCALA